MSRFFGSGLFQHLGETRRVFVCLNLDDNVIEVWHPMAEKSIIIGNDAIKAEVVLTDIHLHMPIGEIVRDRFDNCFISSYSPGTWSVYDSTLARVLMLRGKNVGMTKIVLHPKSTQVEFDLKSYDALSAQYELFYQGARTSFPTPHRLVLTTTECILRGDRDGIAVVGRESLLQEEERIRLCLGIVEGAPLVLRSSLDAAKVSINLIDADERAGMGPLFIKHDDVGTLLQGLYDFFRRADKSEWPVWRRATYFYLQGLSARSLETQFITMCTFLEIVDNADSLRKDAVAKILEIGVEEADLLCKVRNRMTHQGEDLGVAVINTVSELGTAVKALLFPSYPSDPAKTGILFFLRLSTLLNRFWVTRANFKGQWNDYSDYRVN